MFKRRFSRRVPTLNTTSTADISFMLLVFFLVTTSLDTEQGLRRRLAPMPSDDELVTEVRREDVMMIDILAGGFVTVDGAATAVSALPGCVAAFVSGDPQQRVLSVCARRDATYDTYFHAEQAIAEGYRTVRDSAAQARYGAPYALCTAEQRKEISSLCPLRVSERTEATEATEPTERTEPTQRMEVVEP